MFLKSRCVHCREPLPEFNTKNPPLELTCKKCGTKISGEDAVKRFTEKVKQSFERANNIKMGNP